MQTLLNVWHYVGALSVLLLATVGVALVYYLDLRGKFYYYMALLILTAVSLVAVIHLVDAKTKKVRVYGVKHRNIINTEQIVFSGYVENIGSHPIGKVDLKLKLKNGATKADSWRGGGVNHFNTDSFFGKSSNKGVYDELKPQSVEGSIEVARNLKPDQAMRFEIYLPYPAYFNSINYTFEVDAH